MQGTTSDGTRLPPDPTDQQARQMENDARAIKNDNAPLVPGREGLADIRVVRAIMKSSTNDGARMEL
ncbi:hypothetical protein [Salinibacter sp.]|uniref:hypothetical protein n=1 Tax=Salinibacter sp. TaxID=2065818 RepID=UPI0021E8C2DC|nr:hypothetical protein [Salinibacter sp.]